MIRSAGIIFTRAWVDVPEWAEKEISANEYLEVEAPAPVVVEPEPETEPVVDEPQTPADKAVKLVDTRQARAKGKRKL